MPDPSDRWQISDIADLILGGSAGGRPQRTPPPSAPDRPQAQADPEAPRPRSCRAVLVLVNPQQDAVEAVSRYADYWSNRGENVGVLWVGHSGTKLGLFDCARRGDWCAEILDALEREDPAAVPTLLRVHCDRVVAAVVTVPGWTRHPLVEAIDTVCVIVEPAPYQLVGSYDALKSLCKLPRPRTLSCFAINSPSAADATRLGERFYRLGDQFLDRAVSFEGFSLAEAWPISNRVAEAFAPAEPDGRAARLTAALLAEFGETAASPDHDPPDTPVQEDPMDVSQLVAGIATTPAAPPGLPAVRVLPARGAIADVDALDDFLAEAITEIVSGARRSWPVRLPHHNGVRCRWVERHDGSRCVVASTLGSALGALEHAGACLHPAEPGDEIVICAPNLTSEQRRAAEAFRADIRLFEIARLPETHAAPAVLLRDVSGCC